MCNSMVAHSRSWRNPTVALWGGSGRPPLGSAGGASLQARSWPGGDLVGRERSAAAGAGELLDHGATAAAVLGDAGRTGHAGEVAVAPMHQPHDHHQQLAALGGQVVLEPLRTVLVRNAFQHAVVDQAVQPVAEHVARHAQAVDELLEAVRAQEDVPEHEQGPALAHDLEGAGDRADLVVVGPVEHAATIPPVSFVTLRRYGCRMLNHTAG